MAQSKNVDAIVRGPAVLTYNGGAVGYIVKVTNFKHTQERLDCRVQDSNGIVKSEVIAEDVMLSFTLQQVDAESFKMALGQTSTVAGGGDAANGAPIALTLEFASKWRLTIPKAVQSGGLDLNVERNQWSEVPVSFKAISDMNAAAGVRLYTIEDIS